MRFRLIRTAVEQAEHWGEAVLQPLPRWLSWWALAHNRTALRTFAQGAHLRVPLGLAIRTGGPIVTIQRRINAASDDNVRADVAALPAMLDRVDGPITAGTLGGRELNAADYQIATSVRLLMCFDDLRPSIERRPAGPYARRVVPEFPGRLRPVIPAYWLNT
jgi:glutathione S-transferase